MDSRPRSGRLLDLAEANLFAHAFLLHFLWEVRQFRFQGGAGRALHLDAVTGCTWAAAGDAGLSVLAFWLVAALGRGRRWIRRPDLRRLASFLSLGLLLALAAEAISLYLARWRYGGAMPVLHLLGIGLSPVLQWTLVPPILVRLVSRSLPPERVPAPPRAVAPEEAPAPRGVGLAISSGMAMGAGIAVLSLLAATREKGRPRSAGAIY